MIKKVKASAAITGVFFAAMLLCSCSFNAFGYRFTVEPVESSDGEPILRPEVRYYDVGDGSDESEPIGIDYNVIRKNGMQFVFRNISDPEVKENIAAILNAMQLLETDVTLPKPLPVDEVKTLVHFVSDYLCGYTHIAYYTYSYWSDENNEKAYAIRLKYTKDSEQAYDEFNRLNELVDRLVSEAPKDEYEKIRFFYDTVIQKCRFDASLSHENSGNAFGALVDGYAVCQGYANAMQLLLSRAGFDVVPVINYDNSHKWNRVLLSDGNWYDIDATWDDESSAASGGDYACFLVSDKTLKKLKHPTADEAAYFELPKTSDDYIK